MTPERKEEIREKYQKAELTARFRPGGLGPDVLLIGELLDALDEVQSERNALANKFGGRAVVKALRKTMKRCECGEFFFSSEPRQRYCPPLDGRRESLCSKRYRARRLRSKRKST